MESVDPHLPSPLETGSDATRASFQVGKPESAKPTEAEGEAIFSVKDETHHIQVRHNIPGKEEIQSTHIPALMDAIKQENTKLYKEIQAQLKKDPNVEVRVERDEKGAFTITLGHKISFLSKMRMKFQKSMKVEGDQLKASISFEKYPEISKICQKIIEVANPKPAVGEKSTHPERRAVTFTVAHKTDEAAKVAMAQIRQVEVQRQSDKEATAVMATPYTEGAAKPKPASSINPARVSVVHKDGTLTRPKLTENHPYKFVLRQKDASALKPNEFLKLFQHTLGTLPPGYKIEEENGAFRVLKMPEQELVSLKDILEDAKDMQVGLMRYRSPEYLPRVLQLQLEKPGLTEADKEKIIKSFRQDVDKLVDILGRAGNAPITIHEFQMKIAKKDIKDFENNVRDVLGTDMPDLQFHWKSNPFSPDTMTCTITKPGDPPISISLKDLRKMSYEKLAHEKAQSTARSREMILAEKLVDKLNNAANMTGAKDAEFTFKQSDDLEFNKFAKGDLKNILSVLGKTDDFHIQKTGKTTYKILKRDGTSLSLLELRKICYDRSQDSAKASLSLTERRQAEELLAQLRRADSSEGPDPQIEIKKADEKALAEKGGLKGVIDEVFGKDPTTLMDRFVVQQTGVTDTKKSPILKITRPDGSPVSLDEMRNLTRQEIDSIKEKHKAAIEKKDVEEAKKLGEQLKTAEELVKYLDNCDDHISLGKKAISKLGLGAVGALLTVAAVVVVAFAIAVSPLAVPVSLGVGTYRLAAKAYRISKVEKGMDPDVIEAASDLMSRLENPKKGSFEALYREKAKEWQAMGKDGERKLEQLDKRLRADNAFIKQAMAKAKKQGAFSLAWDSARGKTSTIDAEAAIKDARFILEKGLFKRASTEVFKAFTNINYLHEETKQEMLTNMFHKCRDPQSALQIIDFCMRSDRKDLAKALIKEAAMGPQPDPKDLNACNKMQVIKLQATRFGSEFFGEIIFPDPDPNKMRDLYKNFKPMSPAQLTKLSKTEREQYDADLTKLTKALEPFIRPIDISPWKRVPGAIYMDFIASPTAQIKHGITFLDMAVQCGDTKFMQLASSVTDKVKWEKGQEILKELGQMKDGDRIEDLEGYKDLLTSIATHFPGAKLECQSLTGNLVKSDKLINMIKHQMREPSYLVKNFQGRRPIDLMTMSSANGLDDLCGIHGKGSFSNTVAALQAEKHMPSLMENKLMYAKWAVAGKLVFGMISSAVDMFVNLDAVQLGGYLLSLDARTAAEESVINLPIFTGAGVFIGIRRYLQKYLNQSDMERRGIEVSLLQYQTGVSGTTTHAPYLPEKDLRIGDVLEAMDPKGQSVNVKMVAEALKNNKDLEVSQNDMDDLINLYITRIHHIPDTDEGNAQQKIMLDFIFKNCKSSDQIERLFTSLMDRGTKSAETIKAYINARMDNGDEPMTPTQYQACMAIAVKNGDVELFERMLFDKDRSPAGCKAAAEQFIKADGFLSFRNQKGDSLEHLALQSQNPMMLIRVALEINKISPTDTFRLKDQSGKTIQDLMNRDFANKLDQLLGRDPKRKGSFTHAVNNQEFGEALKLLTEFMVILPLKIGLNIALKGAILAAVGAALGTGVGAGIVLGSFVLVTTGVAVMGTGGGVGYVAGHVVGTGTNEALKTLSGVDDQVRQLGSTAAEVQRTLERAQYEHLMKPENLTEHQKLMHEALKDALTDCIIAVIKERTDLFQHEGEVREILHGAYDTKKDLFSNLNNMAEALERRRDLELPLTTGLSRLGLIEQLKDEFAKPEFGQKIAGAFKIPEELRIPAELRASLPLASAPDDSVEVA